MTWATLLRLDHWSNWKRRSLYCRISAHRWIWRFIIKVRLSTFKHTTTRSHMSIYQLANSQPDGTVNEFGELYGAS